VVAPKSWTALRISEFKGLPQASQVRGARVVAGRSGPLASLTVVESATVAFRHAPGLGLLAAALPPPQLGVFADGAFDTAINLWNGARASLAYLDYSPDALACHLTKSGDVLILEPGASVLHCRPCPMRRAGSTRWRVTPTCRGSFRAISRLAQAISATGRMCTRRWPTRGTT